MLTLFGIANCDTIKKTKKLLDSLNAQYEFHDYKKFGIDTELGQKMLSAIELDVLINKCGTTWRKLSPEQQTGLCTNTALALISNNTSLVRRPILHDGNQWLVGYDEAAIKTLVPSQ
jgi:arsenate reductase